MGGNNNKLGVDAISTGKVSKLWSPPSEVHGIDALYTEVLGV